MKKIIALLAALTLAVSLTGLRRRTDQLRSSRGGNRCTGREFHSLCREERIRYDALSLLYHHQPNGGLPTG